MQLLQRLLLLQQEERKAEKCKGGPTVTICPLDEGVLGINLAEGEGLTQHSTVTDVLLALQRKTALFFTHAVPGLLLSS